MTDESIGETVQDLIVRHRAAFASLQRQFAIVDRFDEDSPQWATEQLEVSRLEDEVESAAIAMTTVPLSSVADIVALLSYVDEFSRSNRSGDLLWPDVVNRDGMEMPWVFALLGNIKTNLDAPVEQNSGVI